MKSFVYMIFDTKLNRFNLPFFARTDDEAKVILVRSGIPKSIYEDTKLFKVGEIDDSSISSPLVSFDPVEIKLLPYPNPQGVTL